jgi:hypothetical protein
MSGGGEVRGRLTRTLTVGGVIISVMAGGVSLLFTLQPDLKPCLARIVHQPVAALMVGAAELSA